MPPEDIKKPKIGPILPDTTVPDRKWFLQLAREFSERVANVETLSDAEYVFMNIRLISDELGKRFTKRRDQEQQDVCHVCHQPFIQGRPFGAENLENPDKTLRHAYACGPTCYAKLQDESQAQGRSKPGNLF